MPVMHPSSTDRRASTRTETTPRRTRLRLRDLCDEVLASYRVAKARDPLTSQDRDEAAAVLQNVVPPLRG